VAGVQSISVAGLPGKFEGTIRLVAGSGVTLTRDGSKLTISASGSGGGGGGSTTWDAVTGKPTTFAPSAHEHPIGEVTALQAGLDAKLDDSQRGAANGVASLDANTLIPDAQIPSTIARDSELPDLAAHVAAADPHTGYQRESEKGEQNGYAALDANTRVPTAQHSTEVLLRTLADAKGDLLVAGATDSVSRLVVGTDGQVLTADAAQTLGVKWASAAAGSTNIKEAEIDFGTTPVSEATFTITDADVAPSSQLIAQLAYVAPTGKDLDELEFDALVLRCAPGSGQFTLYATTADGGLVADKFKIHYLVG
jgi:hypothetical protein